MLPRPEKIIFMDGFAAQDARVEEQLCPELEKEEYRIQIAPGRQGFSMPGQRLTS